MIEAIAMLFFIVFLVIALEVTILSLEEHKKIILKLKAENIRLKSYPYTCYEWDNYNCKVEE